MSRYICGNCGCSCDEDELVSRLLFPETLYEPAEWSDPRCPYCNSTDVWEATECPICGEYYAADIGESVCPECAAEIVKTIDTLSEALGPHDTRGARSIIVNFISEWEV